MDNEFRLFYTVIKSELERSFCASNNVEETSSYL